MVRLCLKHEVRQRGSTQAASASVMAPHLPVHCVRLDGVLRLSRALDRAALVRRSFGPCGCVPDRRASALDHHGLHAVTECPRKKKSTRENFNL